ncbi:hypothetical protein F5148DRAFT_637839 [Russula earlei]|uniref:Uncharacterized protein n=1 Tax=Russula earlei TaxID=71964 RepID=A0ACC0UFQ8_9AGAM|nr:hypothetical protein F5148DRAFT_637839 [Russula earlei]
MACNFVALIPSLTHCESAAAIKYIAHCVHTLFLEADTARYPSSALAYRPTPRLPLPSPAGYHSHKAMQTRKLTRHPIQRSSLRASPPQSNALPRRIAAGVFFLDADGVNNIDSDSDDSNDPLPSAKTLATLGITHAVVERGSDLRLTCGMKALFVGRQDPLSRVVGWMRAGEAARSAHHRQRFCRRRRIPSRRAWPDTSHRLAAYGPRNPTCR